MRAVLEGQSIDLAFIDGMHLFEFALRDFINIERACEPNSVILIHDCLPIDAVTSARERTTSVWTGDVWKLVLVLVLKRLRPELHIRTSDLGPSGLAIVTNLDPGSTVLHDRLDELVEEYVSVGYEAIADDKHAALNVALDAWGEVRALVAPPAPTAAAGAARNGGTRAIDVAADAFCTVAFVDEVTAAAGHGRRGRARRRVVS